MALSMTGFGTASKIQKFFQVKCEVQCLNKRHLEIGLNLPRFCVELDLPMRKKIEARLNRGKVAVYFDIQYRSSTKKMVLNEPLMDSWQKELSSLAKKYRLKPDLDLKTWVMVDTIWKVEENRLMAKDMAGTLNQTLDEALRKLILMRKREGKQLEKVMLGQIRQMEKIVQELNKRSGLYVKAYQNKIKKRVSKSDSFTPAENELFTRFVSVFSDKADIHEEITRLWSHCSQLNHYLKKDSPGGRSLDFLLQECNREINTIGSKVSDLKVSKMVVTLKTLVDQLREQAQNVL